MKALFGVLALVGAPVWEGDVAIIRDTLARAGRGVPYCVEARLGEPPFADTLRELARQYPNMLTRALVRSRTMRGFARWGWAAPDHSALDRAMAARVAEAAAELASGGDPLSSPIDASRRPDYGRIERSWLGPRQRLANGCPYPRMSVSAVAHRSGLAFIDVNRLIGDLGGEGETWVLERTPRGWRYVARRRSWIS